MLTMKRKLNNILEHNPLRFSEKGESIISFTIALPIVILITMMMLDVGRYTSVKGMLSKACNRGATAGTATLPSVDAASGPIHEKNVWYNLPPTIPTDPTEAPQIAQAMAQDFYARWRDPLCSGASCTSTTFSDSELFSVAAASQLINEADELLLIPMRDACPDGRNCAWVGPKSYPNTDTEGLLVLECGMTIDLFSSPILNYFSSQGKKRTEITVLAYRTFSK